MAFFLLFFGGGGLLASEGETAPQMSEERGRGGEMESGASDFTVGECEAGYEGGSKLCANLLGKCGNHGPYLLP